MSAVMRAVQVQLPGLDPAKQFAADFRMQATSYAAHMIVRDYQTVRPHSARQQHSSLGNPSSAVVIAAGCDVTIATSGLVMCLTDHPEHKRWCAHCLQQPHNVTARRCTMLLSALQLSAHTLVHTFNCSRAVAAVVGDNKSCQATDSCAACCAVLASCAVLAAE
jgi:hypothetical protein